MGLDELYVGFLRLFLLTNFIFTCSLVFLLFNSGFFCKIRVMILLAIIYYMGFIIVCIIISLETIVHYFGLRRTIYYVLHLTQQFFAYQLSIVSFLAAPVLVWNDYDGPRIRKWCLLAKPWRWDESYSLVEPGCMSRGYILLVPIWCLWHGSFS